MSLPVVNRVPEVPFGLVRGERLGFRVRLTNRHRDVLAWPNHSARAEVYAQPGLSVQPPVFATSGGQCSLDTADGWITVAVPGSVTAAWGQGRLNLALILVRPGGAESTILRVLLEVSDRRGTRRGA